MKENYDSFCKDNFENDESKHNTNNEKKKMMIKYMNTVGAGMMDEEISFSDKSKSNKDISDDEVDEGNYVDSEDHIILTDEDAENLGSIEDNDYNSFYPCHKDDKYSMEEIGVGSANKNDLNSNPGSHNNTPQWDTVDEESTPPDDAYAGHSDVDDKELLRVEEGVEAECSSDVNNLHMSGEEGDVVPVYTKESILNIEYVHMNEKKDVMFNSEIKDINEWKSKYRHLTSSFRKLDKELNKTINSEHIDQITRRNIKQHKDFLDNEYKEWLSILQKTVSEFKKNIGAHVSELNEKEYLILSKNIFEDFKEKCLEESYLNGILYLTVMKHDISANENIVKYLEKCYESTNPDKALDSTIQKLLEVNAQIKDIGGKTGTWKDDEHNYFMKIYENNANFGHEFIVGMLKNCINKQEEEIYKHIGWYEKFVTYNNLRNKYLNSINIINLNEQKKNDSKVEEKKHMIQKWREKKRQDSVIKMKELEEMKKEEMKMNKTMRENIKKKKKMIQEQLISKKEEIKKNKIEKQQKSILSEESLQRISERNERILQKKVQSNLNLNEENSEKDKKIAKQKYMHIQSKLLSNTDNLLKRIESSVETIKHIL
ncbi:hypothetical protein, conserved [Plasmodium gonderi]|uniref:Uncharacterized protein n=1 Tax=Plasmodium gonderi TaxID=77519 RepID=A0A1Y1JDP4_PLAGO|nr:hypothetical protein, conserved [Plasmodium gonderi]GAW80639.1 hypothetical protein, conserved [Plasmodium gonderi]